MTFGHCLRVFPTPVGVFLFSWRTVPRLICLPHARGGVSTSADVSGSAKGSSPRPWGCFFHVRKQKFANLVFPMPVGVFLSESRKLTRFSRLPHARGGVSRPGGVLTGLDASSPRPWGCFCTVLIPPHPAAVFPTPVGVFPPSTTGKNAKPDRWLQGAEWHH